MTTQAVSLGLLPRLRVEHSSADNAGQIYVPTMNWILMVAALALVMGFGSSAALAGAYGLAVSGAMTIVTPLTLSLIKSRTGKESRAAAHRIVAAVHRRHRLPAGESDQARGRRLGAAGIRADHLLADADLAERARLAHGAPAARAEAGARFHRGVEAAIRRCGWRARRSSWIRRRREYRAPCSTTSSSTASCTSVWCC